MSPGKRVGGWVTWGPVWLAVAVVSFANLRIGYHEVYYAWANTPWEASLLAEAWRVGHHQPIYTDYATDHASIMYPPLLPVLVGSVTGDSVPPVRVFRLVNLAAASAALVAGALFLTRGRPVGEKVLATALLFAVNCLTDGCLPESKPYGVALALSLGALALLFVGQRRSSVPVTLAGCVLVAAAFLTKQTAALVAAIPAVAQAISPWPPPGSRRIRSVLLAALPPASVAVTLGVMARAFPGVFFYSVTVPSLVGIDPERLQYAFYESILFVPLFLAVCLWDALARDPSEPHDDLQRWLMAGTAVAWLAGLAAHARTGGGRSSYLHLYVFLTAWLILRFPRIREVLDRASARPLRGLAAGALVAVAGASPCLYLATKLRLAPFRKLGRSGYDEIVTRARGLPGRVICPEDPTVVMNAKGQADRCLVVEWDTLGWEPVTLPHHLSSYLAGADWLVTHREPYWDASWGWLTFWTDTTFRSAGFTEVVVPPPPDGYRLWQRSAHGSVR